MATTTVLVTGASGFLGAHIVSEALRSGYRVRATARGAKIDALKTAYEKYGGRFEAVAVSNIDRDQFPEALVGVDAVIHSASALAGKEGNEELIDNTIQGTLNVVKQTEKAGIKKLVVISSMVTVLNPRNSFTDKDWYPGTRDSAADATPMEAYRLAKTLAEQELWTFADAHPNLDITTVNPPYLYGPFADEYITPPPNSGMSTNIIIQNLLSPTGGFIGTPAYSDVRDVAKVAVLALKSPLTSEVGRKRLIIASPFGLDFGNVLGMLKDKRPALKERLNRGAPPAMPFDRAPVDFERIYKVVGLTKDQFASVEDTMLGAVDSLLRVEGEWKRAGHEVIVEKGESVGWAT